MFGIDFGSNLTALILAGGAMLIRPATAFLLKEEHDGGVLGSLAGIALAGIAAGGAALADVGNIADDWKKVVGVAVGAWITAGAANASLWGGKLVAWLHAKTDDLLAG